MYIQIDNIGFVNKGAQLMLSAIIDRLNKEEELVPKIVYGLGAATSRQIQSKGLFQIVELQRFKIRWERIFSQKYTLDRFGLVKKENIDVILDCSGFRFGDQWTDYSDEKNKRLETYYQTYKKNNSKIVFLPQAFGPFKTILARERIEIVLEYADLVYARDQSSYSYLIDICGNHENIRVAPDFTCLYSPDISHRLYTDVHDAIAIIPNNKMVTHTNSETAAKYKNFLIDFCKWVNQKNERLVILNHEGNEDFDLIQEIMPNLGFECICLNGLDAKEIKGVIGELKLLVSSRFHGLVSGLNQGVPSFCTGWSHKYSELLKDYSLPHNCIDVKSYESAFAKFESVLKFENKYVPQEDIIQKNKQLSIEMWDEIISFLH